METWGYCQPCDRWFYCPQWFDKSVLEPTCPVCGSAPTAIETRQPSYEPQGEQAGSRPSLSETRDGSMERTRIRGLCPKCDDWFDCDEWFDQSVPLPCCPRCRLAPARLLCQATPSTGSDDFAFEIGVGASEVWIG